MRRAVWCGAGDLNRVCGDLQTRRFYQRLMALVEQRFGDELYAALLAGAHGRSNVAHMAAQKPDRGSVRTHCCSRPPCTPRAEATQARTAAQRPCLCSGALTVIVHKTLVT